MCQLSAGTSWVASTADLGLDEHNVQQERPEQQAQRENASAAAQVVGRSACCCWLWIMCIVSYVCTTAEGQTHLLVVVDRRSAGPAMLEEPRFPAIRGARGSCFPTPAPGRAASCQKPPAHRRCNNSSSIERRTTLRFKTRRNLISSRVFCCLVRAVVLPSRRTWKLDLVVSYRLGFRSHTTGRETAAKQCSNAVNFSGAPQIYSQPYP